MTTHLDRSDISVRRLRIIQDAAWQLQQNYPVGALACLLSEINQTNQETRKEQPE